MGLLDKIMRRWDWDDARQRGLELIAELQQLTEVVGDRRRSSRERNAARDRIHALYEGAAIAAAGTPPSGWMRLSELARRSGISARTLRRACEKGDLPTASKRGGGMWMVDVRERTLEALDGFPKTSGKVPKRGA